MKATKVSLKTALCSISGLVATLAVVLTALSVNSSCVFYAHQEELPETAKKLRKF